LAWMPAVSTSKVESTSASRSKLPGLAPTITTPVLSSDPSCAAVSCTTSPVTIGAVVPSPHAEAATTAATPAKTATLRARTLNDILSSSLGCRRLTTCGATTSPGPTHLLGERDYKSLHRVTLSRIPRMSSLPGRAFIVAASLAALFAAAACSKSTQQQQGFTPPPAQVGVVTVAPTSIAEPYEFVGQVEPYRRVEVRSRVDGIVTDRPFVEGSLVSKGQILYKLDVVKYDAAYRSAVARLDNAKRTLARLEPLVPKHAVAQQDVDNARSDLESAQAAVDVAKKDLDDTVIRAEIAGQVGRARLELGARVTGPADLLTTIDELNQVYVTLRPSSQQLLSWQRDPQARRLLNPGGGSAVVQVVLPDGSQLPRTGRINFIAPSLD